MGSVCSSAPAAPTQVATEVHSHGLHGVQLAGQATNDGHNHGIERGLPFPLPENAELPPGFPLPPLVGTGGQPGWCIIRAPAAVHRQAQQPRE
jgi:hypothetical protein